MNTSVFGALLVMLGIVLIGVALAMWSRTVGIVYAGVISIYLGACCISAQDKKGGNGK